MSFIIGLVIGIIVGAVAAFFVGRNNQTALQAAYTKSLAAQAVLKADLEALEKKV